MIIPLRDENPTSTRPVVTYALIGINVAVFLVEFVAPEPALDAMLRSFGVVPAELMADPVREAHTVLTSMFLHGGWMHLIGNMWFLYIFGDNVEDRLGKPWFVVFYLAAGIGASALQVLASPGSTIPTIGASGAIAGVLGAYALMYPQARVQTLVWLFIFLRVLRIPAVFYLGFWFALQFIQGVASIGASSMGGVAWWAHIGGFLVGIGVGWFLRKGSLPRPPGRRRLRTTGDNPGVVIRLDDRRPPTYH